MLIASFLIGTLIKNDVNSFFQSINQIWRQHIFCGIQLFWFGVYFTVDHFQVLRQQKCLKWIGLLIFTAISGAASSITIGLIKYAKIESDDDTAIYIWSYCLIPNVFILLIKDFLPFPCLFSVISCSVCAIAILFNFFVHFLQVLGKTNVVIPENEFCRASLTLFTIILQAFMFILGFISEIGECNIEYDLLSLISYFSS